MIKYFDASFNDISDRMHSSSLDYKENDIMVDLGKFAGDYGFERVYDYKKANLVVTNTVYPEEVLEWCEIHDIPKIKRMDGIYWRSDKINRNDLLNEASLQSDGVIFISEYSRFALHRLYEFLPKDHTVILNDVDDEVFYTRTGKLQNDRFISISSATDWNREEKRLGSIIDLANNFPDDDFVLFGKTTFSLLPKNIITFGYIKTYSLISSILSEADIYLSLYFRDAGSKTTNQGLRCGLPVLYTSSGCLPELVKNNGIMIKDYSEVDFMDSTPNLGNINTQYIEIKERYLDIKDNFVQRPPYSETIRSYFDYFLNFI